MTLLEKIQITHTGPILEAILDEYIRATEKHWHWPNDVIHAAAIVQEESGELIRAALQVEYENGEMQELQKEAVQTGAMTIRFLINMGNY